MLKHLTSALGLLDSRPSAGWQHYLGATFVDEGEAVFAGGPAGSGGLA